MIYENVRKICDNFYFMDAVRRFLLQSFKQDTKFKHKKTRRLEKSSGPHARFKSYSTLGSLRLSCQTQYLVSLFVI